MIRRENDGAMKVPLRHEGWRKGTLKALFRVDLSVVRYLGTCEGRSFYMVACMVV